MKIDICKVTAMVALPLVVARDAISTKDREAAGPI